MSGILKCRNFEYVLGERTLIMGIVNVTPDSFSDGGKYNDIESALKHAAELKESGADILDIGGESTRPGFTPVSESEEMARVLPVLERLKGCGLPISVDTTKPSVARAVLEAGAAILNDIGGGIGGEMAYLAAEYKAGLVIMHNGTIDESKDEADEVRRYFDKAVNAAVKCGVDERYIILDPGVGFGKTYKQNLGLIRNLSRARYGQLAMLLGTSRKSVIGYAINLPVNERLEGTIATCVAGIGEGADILRVHDVLPVKRAAIMADALYRG